MGMSTSSRSGHRLVRPVPHDASGMRLASASTALSSVPPREFRSPPTKSGASVNDSQALTERRRLSGAIAVGIEVRGYDADRVCAARRRARGISAVTATRRCLPNGSSIALTSMSGSVDRIAFPRSSRSLRLVAGPFLIDGT